MRHGATGRLAHVRLTDKTMSRAALPEREQWIADDASLAAGSLVARIGRKPARGDASRIFYFRWRDHNGRQDRLPIGAYASDGTADPDAAPGGALSLKGARQRARLLADLVHSGERDLRDYFERQRQAAEETRLAAAEAARQARAAAEAAALAAERGSLEKLVSAYLGSLDAQGRPSAADARRTLELHVIKAHPGLAGRKAADLGPGDLRPVFAKLIEAGKGRTAAKLRSLLHAAYQQAAKAEHNPRSPAVLLNFGITSNPVAIIDTMAEFNRVGERALSEVELGAYLRELLVQRCTFGVKAALFLSLTLGGQRLEQLLRVRESDVDLTEGTALLRDLKGRRRQPRLHILPLTPLANEVFSDLIAANRDAPGIFSAHGSKRIQLASLSKVVREISTRMVTAGTVALPFKLSDIRRTCETHMARLGIAREVRAQLQSHAMGNIIDRHYLRHLFLEEKRQALVIWERELERLALLNIRT